MATITGSTNNSLWTFKLETSEGAYNASNNTSPLIVRVYIGRSSSASYMQGADINIVVECTGCSAQQVRYRNTGRVDIAAGGWLLVGTVTFGAVPHNSDGSKIVRVTASFTQSIVSPSRGSADGYVTLESIPQHALIQSVPSYFTDESNLKFSFTNALASDTDSLEACISYDNQERDIKYRSVSSTGASGEYEFNFTSDERSCLQKWVSNGSTKRKVYLYLRTEIYGGFEYDSAELELEIVNCTPTFNPTIVDTNNATIELTGNPSTLVRHKSEVSVNSGAAGAKHATIKSQFIRVGGKTLNSGSGTLTNLTNGYFEFRATDSRGVMGSHDLLVETFVDYSEVTCDQNVTIGLDSGDNTTASARITLEGVYFSGSFGKSNNSLAFEYRIKEVGRSWSEKANESWQELTVDPAYLTIENGRYIYTTEIAGLDYSKSYVIQCKAQDRLMEAPSSEYQVQTQPVFDWGANDFNFNVPVMFKGGLTPIEIPRYTDLNTITTPGLYRCLLNVDVATLSNCPADVAFIMEVLPNQDLTQRITEHEVSRQPRMFMRNHYNNKWCKWYEYAPRLNTFGAPVNLFSIDLSDANGGYYEFPCDGYLVTRASYRAGYYINFILYGSAADGGYGFDISVTSGSSNGMQGNPTNVTFVRKGMLVMSLYTNDTTYNSFQFYPLT